MNVVWRRRPERPFYKGLIDGLYFVIVLALLVLTLQKSGLIVPDTGRFTAVDGDSLRKGDEDYRLFGIDAPELQQNCRDAKSRAYPCGREAQRALARLIGAPDVSCLTRETDRYGRNVATCKAGELEVNAELVRLGWAIAYRRHSTDYLAEEAEAQGARRGIWAGAFDNPEQWRNINRGALLWGAIGD